MKLVILDRNGSINLHRDDFVKSETEWTPLPRALEAIARLNHAGWHVVIASNQSGLGRGLFDVASLNAMHAKMHKMLAAVGGRVDAIFYCPHSPDEDCGCRKPKPGLFLQIGERYGVDLANVPTAGDSLRDLQAGAAAGCEPH
ncbi:MAG: D-glycero-beta-D-manno-heptose 1,7-bisphosphate 7-phosphatase, partial [Variovorax sp.]